MQSLEPRGELGGEDSIVEPQLGERKMIRLFGILVGDIGRQIGFEHAAELFVIIAEHHHIRVIVPWDKALVTNCAEQRTAA